MDKLMQAISTVGFPIVMCGALCYYVNTTLSKLTKVIEENTAVVKILSAKIGLDTEKEEDK